ncbi:lipocalin-like protein [Edaphobacter aggregans]|uniref:Lipocalin-like protein n=1 Tax=Edaphobacter aggregans TaxID=570835 RepID=A0A428MEB0_9BACT|nr:lipocalin-like domain-containing protein [Edaphobacter aggregans]RSL15202.1 lipocalin-like protein [Edaphobacter aggregans]
MTARILSLIATLALAVSSMHAQVDTTNPFVGSWKLIAADKLLPDGTRVADYGTQPHGMAIFTADGRMMIEVFRDVRGKFAGNDRAKGTFDEYKDAALSSSCSFGTYSVDPTTSKVTMKIDRSTFPNYDDTTQVRAYQLKDDILSWRVPARPDGSIPVTVLRRIAK